VPDTGIPSQLYMNSYVHQYQVLFIISMWPFPGRIAHCTLSVCQKTVISVLFGIVSRTGTHNVLF